MPITFILAAEIPGATQLTAVTTDVAGHIFIWKEDNKGRFQSKPVAKLRLILSYMRFVRVADALRNFPVGKDKEIDAGKTQSGKPLQAMQEYMQKEGISFAEIEKRAIDRLTKTNGAIVSKFF